MSMTMKATKSGGGGEGGFAKAPPGNHPAVLVAIVDMGTQLQDGYQGAPSKWMKRAFFVWELVHERVEGTKDRNHLIGFDLTVSLNEKAKLRKFIEARSNTLIPEGADYDITQELGKPCLLNVIMKGSYPKVDGVSALPKGMTCPAPQNKPYLWTLDKDYKAAGKIELPDWIPWLYGKPLRDHISGCKEIVGTGSTAAPNGPAAQSGGASAPASGPGAAGPPPRRRAAADPTEPMFYVAPNGGDPLPDPLPASAIKDKLTSGAFGDGTEVCAVGADEWVKADDVPAVRPVIPF